MATTSASGMTESLQAIDTGCGLLDRSERGKLALTGADAKPFLAGQVTNDVEALTPGRGVYAALLTHKGKMRADLRVLDLGDELWLDTERVALQALFDTIRRFKIGYDVELHKRTLQQALLSLLGPRARDVAGADAAGLGRAEHDSARSPLGVLVTTEGGVDVICPAEEADAVRTALVDAGAVGVGEAAAEVVRVERGRPRFGVDLEDESVIPQEAGLNERAVSFTKGCYVGQETVARLHYKGRPNRHLRGLRLSGPAATGETLRLGEREVGRVGSVVASPRFGDIALALVRREAEPGARLEVGDGGVTAEVVELPFQPPA
jgi:tRNA-modifying protein YgfZ